MLHIDNPGMHHTPPHLQGFTLLEVIIYVGIAAIILGILANLNIRLIEYQSRSDTRNQVGRDIVPALERLKQEIHYAVAIDAARSVFNIHPGKLQLTMRDASLNPTILEAVPSGTATRLAIRQGTGPQQFLTADTVDVERLVFYNLSSPAPRSTRNIRIALRLKFLNPNNVEALSYAITATTSIELMNR